MEQIYSDILVIGFGQGSKILARHMGKMGIETIPVEQSEKMFGATCINKSYLHKYGNSAGNPKHSLLGAIFAASMYDQFGAILTILENLAAAGLTTNSTGYISVNERLQTSQPHIWALGDINGSPQFTYISLDDYHIIRKQWCGSGERITTNRKNVPFCVFISPPLAHVGVRKKEAVALGTPIKISKIPAGIVSRSLITGQTEGLLKAIIHRETDQILGFTLFCIEAQEFINTVWFAMEAGLTFSQLKNHINTHPSMTEAFNYFDCFG